MREEIRDWNVKFTKYEGLESGIVEPVEYFKAKDTLPLHLVPTGRHNSVLIQSAYFPLCGREETFKAFLYPSRERRVWNFKVHSIVAFKRDRMSGSPSTCLEE